MMFDTMFWVVVQSSFFLGLLHGIAPCGHSWLVLAPFVAPEKNGRKVFLLTLSFLFGTTMACLLIGFSLGSLSEFIPHEIGHWVDMVTAVIVIILGVALLIKPSIVHGTSSKGCDCGHDHLDHIHDHKKDVVKKFTLSSLFLIGFINMIIPCPTAAIMYSYALKSESYIKSILIFLVYAVSTGMAVSAVIWFIYKGLSFIRGLNKKGVDLMITRCAGVLTIIFGVWFLFWG